MNKAPTTTLPTFDAIYQTYQNIYDTSTETPVKLFDAAISDVYLTSVGSCQFDNGGYNIRVENNVARISSTGQFRFNDYITSTQTYSSTIRLQELVH